MTMPSPHSPPDEAPTALVTGSSRGIGFAIARELCRAGFRVVLNARRDTGELAQAERRLSDEGASVLALPFDVSDLSAHAAAIEAVHRRFGSLDCLVNNAGISVRHRGDLLSVQPDDFDAQIATNLRGPFFLTQAVARTMLDSPSPRFRSIISISSSNAVAVAVDRGEYCIAKSALSMMTRLFAVRLAEAKVNVYEVRPGLIRTRMTEGVSERYDEMIERGFSPINRWGEPEEVGEAVAALACGRMRFSTGDALHIDGGLLIPRY